MIYLATKTCGGNLLELESSRIFLGDVLVGLRTIPKRLPCKYFYDERGSALFDRICQLDEYYLTRTELDLMEQFAVEMGEQIGPGAMLVEYGSGSSVKTRYLLDGLTTPAAYVPVDISGEHLHKTARELKTEPVAQFVLWRQSYDVAIGLSDFISAADAIDELEQLFDVDGFRLRLHLLTRLELAWTSARLSVETGLIAPKDSVDRHRRPGFGVRSARRVGPYLQVSPGSRRGRGRLPPLLERPSRSSRLLGCEPRGRCLRCRSTSG